MKIVMFSQTWCGPCRQLKPHLEAAAKQLGYDVETVNLDTIDQAKAEQYLNDFDIEYTPTVFVVSGDTWAVGYTRLQTTDPHVQKPNALAIKAELEQYL